MTDAERFRPLHAAMLEIIGRLQSEFDVEHTEGYGLDEELERRVTHAGPCVRLTPSDFGAAPIAVVFTDFPGLHLRFGRWHTEPFPSCGCDACDESAVGEIERLKSIVQDVTAGRFREGIQIPWLFTARSGWMETELWSNTSRAMRRGRIDRRHAFRLTGGARRMDLDWKPWPRRHDPG